MASDALLAFDMVVVRALGGAETVDAVRKKLHGAAQTPKGAPRASAVGNPTNFSRASSFSRALKRASMVRSTRRRSSARMSAQHDG